MSRKTLLCTTVVAFLGLVPFCGGPAQAGTPTAVSFNFANTHLYNGFGVQNWVTSEHPAALKQVLQDTNAVWVRMGSIAPTLPASVLTSGMSVQTMVTAMFQAESAALAKSTTTTATLLKSLHIGTHVIAWGVPVAWCTQQAMTSNGKTTTGYYVVPTHIQDYANYVTAQVQFALQSGFNVSYVEPSNEPNGSWNTQWTPATYALFIDALHTTLGANGLPGVWIEGPGTSELKDAPGFLAALAPYIAIGDLAAISAHAWDTGILHQDVAGVPATLRTALATLTYPVQLHVTEYSEINPKWSAAPFGGGPSVRGVPNNSADSPDYAVSAVAETLQLIGDGATETSFWQAQDLSWGKDSHGLADLQGNMRPVEQALHATMGQISTLYTKAVGGASTNTDVISAAFAATSSAGTPNGVIVELVNLGTTALTVTPTLNGFAVTPHAIVSQTAFLGSGATAPTSFATLSGGKLSITMPARSVATVKVSF